MPVVQLELKTLLFRMPKYNEIRKTMLNELANYCQPDLNIVLFGIPESDFDTNYRIIVTVQKYILNSKRFER